MIVKGNHSKKKLNASSMQDTNSHLKSAFVLTYPIIGCYTCPSISKATYSSPEMELLVVASDSERSGLLCV
jgi:hypothetical protein